MNTEITISIENLFHLLKNATVCLDDDNCDIVHRDLCSSLFEKWNIKRSVLAKAMNEFGYIYMAACSDCLKEYEWDEVCTEFETDEDICPECNPKRTRP